MTEERTYYSLEEAAKLLNVNYQLIYNLVHSGKIRAVKLGRIYRIEKSDLYTFLENAEFKTDGHRCTSCGKIYQSETSVKEQCLDPDCKNLICFDCWSREELRYCKEHQKKRTGG